VSSFLTAHQHIIGHSVPQRVDTLKSLDYNVVMTFSFNNNNLRLRM